MLKTLLKTYFPEIISSSFIQKIMILMYSNLYKKDPKSSLKLVLKFEKDETDLTKLYFSTVLTDEKDLTLEIYKNSILLDVFEEELETFSIKSRDLELSFNRNGEKVFNYSVIESFLEEALTTIVKKGFVSESKSVFFSLEQQKLLLKVLGFAAWVEPKFIFRTLINTNSFTTNKFYYDNENQVYYKLALEVETNAEKLLLRKGLNPYDSNKIGVINSDKDRRKIFYWFLESLITDDVLGLSTFVPKRFSEEDPDYVNFNWVDGLVKDFIKSILESKFSVYDLIKDGSLGEHTPALISLAEVFKKD
jgi:hypothetical protein